MNYTIRLNDDGTFSLLHTQADGDTITVGNPMGWEDAIAALSTIITEHQLAAQMDESMDSEGEDDLGEGDGLLPDAWVSDAGIAFCDLLPGGRDFTDCVWTWRDPKTTLVPLTFQRANAGHYDADLVGFIEEFTGGGNDTVHARGRFYDCEAGEMARDILLGGRRFGVSVDPSEAVDCQFQCTEMDEEGWCVDGVYAFLNYEIAGLTMVPMAGFAQASIILDGPPATSNPDEPVEAVAAAAPVLRAAPRVSVGPDNPPLGWFQLEEPRHGALFLDGRGEDYLVEQGQGRHAVPLTITDDGQVFGHLAVWGTCYVGGQAGVCIEPPESAAAYAHFHVGETRTDDGTTLATGTLTIGCDHAPEMASDGRWLDPSAARDFYANAGLAWARVRASNGEHGPWISGALMPGIESEQLTVIRSLTLSGDWRRIGGNLELIGALSVIAPGFPVAREAIAASALPQMIAASALPRSTTSGGAARTLIAAGLVQRCVECGKRHGEPDASLTRGRVGIRPEDLAAKLDRIESRLAVLDRIDRRTRHLNADAAQAIVARIGRG